MNLLFAAGPPLLPIALPLIAGFLAVYLLLPRPRPYRRLWGAVSGAVAILLAGWFLVRTGTFTAEALLFYAFAGIAIVAGGLLITQRNPAYAALSFALVVLSTCGLFLLQAAPFLMAATTIIYAGAVVVTFLFVLMLAHTEGPDDANDRTREPFLASVAGFVLLGALLYVLGMSYDTRTLDGFLVAAGRAAQKDSPDEINRELGAHAEVALRQGVVQLEQEKDKQLSGGDKYLACLRLYLEGQLKTRGTPEMVAFHKQVQDAEFQWLGDEGSAEGVKGMKEILAQLVETGQRIRVSAGDLEPGPAATLSDFSGPPPNRRIERDARGNAVLPAENVAYLGRALFTDYLLAVELAGTLLLVATIGAIAIATRTGERAT